MSSNERPAWSFLSNHGKVFVSIAVNPDGRLREIGERVGITERAAHRIVRELVTAGYVSRERQGRRNRYTIHPQLLLPDELARDRTVSDLLAVWAP